MQVGSLNDFVGEVKNKIQVIFKSEGFETTNGYGEPYLKIISSTFSDNVNCAIVLPSLGQHPSEEIRVEHVGQLTTEVLTTKLRKYYGGSKSGIKLENNNGITLPQGLSIRLFGTFNELDHKHPLFESQEIIKRILLNIRKIYNQFNCNVVFSAASMGVDTYDVVCDLYVGSMVVNSFRFTKSVNEDDSNELEDVITTDLMKRIQAAPQNYSL